MSARTHAPRPNQGCFCEGVKGKVKEPPGVEAKHFGAGSRSREGDARSASQSRNRKPDKARAVAPPVRPSIAATRVTHRKSKKDWAETPTCPFYG